MRLASDSQRRERPHRARAIRPSPSKVPLPGSEIAESAIELNPLRLRSKLMSELVVDALWISTARVLRSFAFRNAGSIR